MIIRVYLHIYVAYYHRETKQTNGGGDCGGIVATAVTVAVTSCDAVESECGIPYLIESDRRTTSDKLYITQLLPTEYSINITNGFGGYQYSKQ